MKRSTALLLLLPLALATIAHGAVRKPVRTAPAPAAPAVNLAPADDEQRAAAAKAYLGPYACEFGQSVQVSADRVEGYLLVRFGKQTYTMRPVVSPTTGALRLEDVRGRTLFLQIPVKSMLLDEQAGRRVVDECVHAQQAENRRLVAAAPPQPRLLEGFDPAAPAAPATPAAAEPSLPIVVVALAGEPDLAPFPALACPREASSVAELLG